MIILKQVNDHIFIINGWGPKNPSVGNWLLNGATDGSFYWFGNSENPMDLQNNCKQRKYGHKRMAPKYKHEKHVKNWQKAP